jgi:hypothetical protein
MSGQSFPNLNFRVKMSKKNLLYCATDKEIHDVLMSAKQRIHCGVLLELAKDRKIFYSPADTREDLIHQLSLLPHGYHELSIILEQREHAGRAEKVTSVTLNANLTVDELKEIAKEYVGESPDDEKVTTFTKGVDQVFVNIKYSDVDYGKTRLIQRTPKEAGIEFHVSEGKTVVRMPANTKAKEIFDKLRSKLESKRKAVVPLERIEIGDFNLSQSRTEFFTTLISKLDGFKLDNVTSVKVEPIAEFFSDDELDLDDDQSKEEAKQEALALVKNVALKGETLLASEEYQSLLVKGFFITSIIWRSKFLTDPFPIVEFEAAFEQPELGKGFRYNVRGSLNLADGEYTKTLRPLDAVSKEKYLSILEKTASKTVREIRAVLASEAADPEEGPI